MLVDLARNGTPVVGVSGEKCCTVAIPSHRRVPPIV